MSKEIDKLLDHDYDGIKELDNPLPEWWLLTFYGAIVFAIAYFAYYHLGNGPSLRDELNTDLQQVKQQKLAQEGKSQYDESSLLAVFNDSSQVKLGGTIYKEKCESCHAPGGGGSIGPNLTDKFWIHGEGTLSSIVKVISEGVADKGMPPWGAILKKEELYAVTAYVHTLAGTKPANPKAPQGVEVK